MDLKGRNFLTLKDFTPDEILGLLDLAADLKARPSTGCHSSWWRRCMATSPMQDPHGNRIAGIQSMASVPEKRGG